MGEKVGTIPRTIRKPFMSLIGFRQTYANNVTGYVLRFIVGQRSFRCNENQDRGSRS